MHYPSNERDSRKPIRTKTTTLDLGIERLESREMLAVTVTASGTTAVITGDSGNNTVNLSGTTISGTNVTLTTSFEIRQGKIKTYRFDMKGGADTVVVDTVFGFKNVSVDGGDGNNTVVVLNSELRQLKILNGNGDDSTQVSDTQIGLDINGNTGLIDIRNGEGGSDVLIESTGPGSGRSLHANRVSILNGIGENDIEISDIRARRTTFVIGHLSGVNRTRFSNVDKARSIRVIKQSGFVSNPGDGAVELSDTQVGSVFVLTAGTRELSSLSSLTIGSSEVASSTTHIASGTTKSTTTIDDSEVNAVRIDNRGPTVFGSQVFVNDSRVKGLFQVNHRPDPDSSGAGLVITDSTFDRPFHLRVRNAGSVTDIRDTNLKGTFNIATSAGTDRIFIDDTNFFGIARFNTGQGAGAAGQDRIAIEQENHAGETRFMRPVFINTGAGDDLLQLGGAGFFTQRVTFESTLRMDGGTGNDELTHQTGFFPEGTVSCSRIETSTLNC